MKYLTSLCVLIWALSAANAAVPPPDKLLPADTVAMVTIADYQQAKKSSDKFALARLWKDEAMKPFREKFMTKFKEDLVVPLEREFGVKFADYKDLCQGQITLAFMPRTGGQTDSGMLLLIDTKDKAGVLKTNLAALKQKWIDSGKVAKTDKIRDVEFTTLVYSSGDLSKTLDKVLPSPKKDKEEEEEAEEEKKPAKKVEWLVGQSDSLLIVGSSAKDIEKILIRQAGGAVPALAEHGPFAANYGTLFRDTPTYGWVNLKAIVDLISAKPKEEDKAAEKDEEDAEAPAIDETKLMSALGLGGLQSLAFAVKDSNEGSLATFTITAPEASRRGIARILSHEARDASPPPFVPADVVKFTRWRIDLPKAFASLESMLVDINPAYAGIIKLFVDNAGKDKDPNFDLRKNLIANLGDDLIIYEKKPKEATLDGNAPTVYLVSSPRAEQMAAAVKAVTAFLPTPPRLKEREFLGRTVYTVNLPPSGGQPGSRERRAPSEPRVLSYAASGSYVVFSTDTPLLEEYLRANEARALRETTGLAQAAEQVGGMGTGLFGFENQQESMRVLFEALKKDTASIEDLLSGSQFGRQLDTDEDKKFKEWFDLSLLPNFDKVSKYFGIAVWSGAVSTDGLTFRWFAPTPAGMK
jgi:hypothetical protein